MLASFVIFILNTGILTAVQGQRDCIESYPPDWKEHYDGMRTTTVTGKTCMMWSETNQPSYGISNYCRAPLQDPESSKGPWCYIDKDPWWEFCFVPLCNKDCRKSATDKKYEGTLNVTISGYHCRQWSLASVPPSGGYRTQFPEETLNYCRAPNADIQTTPWCYTTSTQKRWEHCNISLCGDIKSTLCPDLNGSDLLMKPSILTGYQYNSIVIFKCKNGYRINGPSAIKCTVDAHKSIKGHWNASQPQCKAVPCPNINASDLFIEPSTLTGYNYNSVVTFKCKMGYKIQGFPGIKCTVKSAESIYGHWNVSQPKCLGIECPIISLNHSNVLHSRKRFPQTIQVKCDRGYILKGNGSIQCTESGKWSNLPTCDAVLCPDLNVSDLLISRQSNLTRYKYESVVTFDCKNGYRILGSSAIMCTVDSTNSIMGHWNTTQPDCVGVECEMIEVEHLNISSLRGKIFRFPDTIHVDCYEHYKLNGTSTIQCTESGKWSDKPTCIDAGRSFSFAQSSSPGAAIGGGISAAVLVVFIVIIVVIFIKRRQRESNSKDEPTNYKEPNMSRNENTEYSEIRLSGIELVEGNHSHLSAINISSKDRTYNNELNEDGGYYDFTEGPQMSKTAILVKDFYNYVENGRGKGGKIEDEFFKLKTGLQYPTTAALKPGNKIKNKYKNLFAYDATRVVLNTTPHQASDYINSCYINGYERLKKYIASQGPQDNTVNEFWQMVWQVDCGKIVMLTNVFEEAKQKCNQYWPETVGKSADFDGIVIALAKEDMYSEFTIRHIKLLKEKEKKTVIQFHFTAWPDKDVPKYSSSLVHFRHKVNSTESSSKGPVIVHCSAGIGRTGTYIALDYSVTEATEVGYVDVFRCVETLRRQRVNMVQTARQYVFLHDAVLEALVCPYTGIPTSDFPEVYKDLMKFDSTKKKHKLHVEYDFFTSLSTNHDEDDFKKGKNPENRKKNRYSNIIPVESEMPRLISTVEGHNEYINAVFLPGYKSSRAFVVTQMPMENTLVDFWRLVYDYEISVIVMLNTEYEQKDVYWPQQKDEIFSLGPFKIKQKNLARKKHYVVMEVSLTYNHDQKRVTIFQQMFWNDDKTIPDNIEDFFSFITDIEDARGRESGEGTLLVHCLNGCDKSGLYCVMSTVIEKMRIEHDVDIQHTIKQMRNRRPQIISNYEQFRFLYEAVIEYLKQFETYANFS